VELIFEISGDQIDGARDYQEDAFLITYLDDEQGGDGKSSSLLVMADGMGGHAAGNIASNMVVSTFNKSFTGGFGGDQPVPELLQVCLAKANGALTESIKETPALDGMGCTMVTAVFNRGKAYWISVGDSHLYLIRDRELIKKNEDHSYGGYLDRMAAQGVDMQAEAGLSRNMLMSAMTGEEIAEVDCPDEPLQLLPGDRLVLCSDGLDTLSAGVIIQTSAWSTTPKECVAALLKAVEDADKPRQDNTTVVVIDVQEKEAPQKVAAEPEPIEKQGAGDTQEMSTDEIREAINLEEKTEKGGKGGIMAIAAVLVLALLGGGGWFMFGGGGEAPAPVTEVSEPVTEPAKEATTETTEQAVEETQAETKTETAAATPTPSADAGPKVFKDALKSGGEGPEMVMIPAGTFKMGAKGFSASQDELPQHSVSVEAFVMSTREITIAEYDLFAKATKREVPDLAGLDKEKNPMIVVSWDDASAYARWLSKETGKKYSLPTEAQWEYAARAATTSTYWWGFELGEEHAHCFDCKTGLNARQPTKVGRFEPNPFGLFDTSGNVWEWTRDCYHKNYTGAPDDGATWEGGDCSKRVVRGGAYGSTSKSLRSAKRDKRAAVKGIDEVGIRIVREP
jgi:formylglycine-generating enzyme required for sulfatase activity/serine/threonine protein phosphatase PrpC